MQVQLQMFVYSLTLCYLVVWTKLGVFVNEVPFDSLFIQLVVDKQCSTINAAAINWTWIEKR